MDDITHRRRRDALPEHTRYADNGCELHNACLTCPLEQCKFDRPGGASGVRRRKRNAAIVSAAARGGATPADLASMFGLSRRTVFRVLQENRSDYLRAADD